MKMTGKPELPATFPANLSSKALKSPPDSDLQHKSITRKPSRRLTGNWTCLKRTGAPSGRRSRPNTPLLRLKLSGCDGNGNDRVEDDQKSLRECRRKSRRRKRQDVVVLSARKLAAGLWRLHIPQVAAGAGEACRLFRGKAQLGLQHGVGHVGIPFPCHPSGEDYGSEAEDRLQSPSSIAGTKNRFLRKLESSFQISNSAMEGATKWDPVCLKTSDEVLQIYSHTKLLDQQLSAVSVVSVLEAKLEQARARIQELETEHRYSKKKLEHLSRKISEERASWRSREHEKIRVFIDDLKAELNRERKNRQRIEVVNSKLVNELADTKLSAKRFMQDYEKERKARELIEEVCDELVKEIGEDKTEVEVLKRESMKLLEEVEEERRMLQMAEVWREERVQMKLVDAKVALEEKYSQMSKLVADLEKFMRPRSSSLDGKEMREVDLLREAAASVNIQLIKEFSYEPPNSDDIFSVFEDVNFAESNEREIEPCIAYSPASPASKIHTVSPVVNVISKDRIQRHSHTFVDENGDMEEDESGWETVSHLEDQGSSYSLEGTAPYVIKNSQQSNVSRSRMEWDENAGQEPQITEIREVLSVPTGQLKNVSSITRLWKSCPGNDENFKIISVEGMKGRLSNELTSNGSIMSPDRVSGKSGISPPDLVGRWSSPECGYPYVTRGMKGCIPRGTQKSSLKAQLLEARMESQKVQLRHVLKQ
ncbi:hypothetical protein I3842_12G128300 [Carya illinoinensis]|uniref:Uncharacterized protein n=2 Tax=Carya illinoinensis TaxID=32201 RepID=A0A922IWR6_CARIL|nr:hypothetical protein I3842_12G128300 [Carya illinoinensis]